MENTLAYYNMSTITVVIFYNSGPSSQCYNTLIPIIGQKDLECLSLPSVSSLAQDYLTVAPSTLGILALSMNGRPCWKSLPGTNTQASNANGTARLKNCNQLFEYQHLLLLRDIWWSKF